MRQHTALRCYLRRLAPLVRSPQPPKISFVDNSHASAYPAAGTISDKGRLRRRSVKNRRPFECFKSAEGIRFSVVARTTPKSFHRGGFWCYLLAAQKVTYVFWYSGSSLRRPRPSVKRVAGLRWGEAAARAVLRTAFCCCLIFLHKNGSPFRKDCRLSCGADYRQYPKICSCVTSVTGPSVRR